MHLSRENVCYGVGVAKDTLGGVFCAVLLCGDLQRV